MGRPAESGRDAEGQPVQMCGTELGGGLAGAGGDAEGQPVQMCGGEVGGGLAGAGGDAGLPRAGGDAGVLPAARDIWEEVYRQACYECSSPVCFRTDCTCHHVRYRAHGGTDDEENLTPPCAFCHLWGEHEGRLEVTGTAAFLVWLLGRKPILEVRGREMRRVA